MMTGAGRWSVAVVGLLAVAGASTACRRPPPPTDVVLVTLDTTRRDHLGAYGYAGASTPELDRFAYGSDLYTRAYASSSWTIPSHASMLTGLYPSDHGARLRSVAGPEAPVAMLRPEVTTLAEHLHAHGYATGAFIGAPLLDSRFGLDQGFDVYDDDFRGEGAAVGRQADELTARAVAWLQVQHDRPIFLFVNYFDAHKPYRPSEPCRVRHEVDDPNPLARARALYDAEICFMDGHFGALLDALAHAGRLDAAVVAVVADHGEAFGEHGEHSHGKSLIEPLIRVPLLVKQPRQRRGRRREELFEARRLFELLLDEAGVPRPLVSSAPAVINDGLVSELMVGLGAGRRAPLRTVIVWPWKLVRPPEGEPQLFDLGSDPGEHRNLWGQPGHEAGARLDAKLTTWLTARASGVEDAAPAAMDPSMEKRLRALGYVF